MRQGNGSELLGSDDPRCSEIGMLHVSPTDEKKVVLAAIIIQERISRIYIVLDLPRQNRAFINLADFDDLKAIRRKIRGQIILIVPPGSLSEYARQCRFPVYASLEEYARALGGDWPPDASEKNPLPQPVEVQWRKQAPQSIGKYRILAELGEGAYGRVYKAQHQYLTNRIVALKQLQSHIGRSAQARQLFFDQFLQEARTLEALSHPGILPLLDFDVADDLPYLVTEFAPRGSLRDRLHHQMSHPLSLNEALPLLLQIGQALQYAHQQNIVHRDLKPENLLFRKQDELLLADFGIAVLLDAARTTRIGVDGTLAYMAPEQFRGLVSVKSDQYALGCIAYELLTGRQPFVVSDPTLETMWYQHTKVAPVPPTQLNPSLCLTLFCEGESISCKASRRGE